MLEARRPGESSYGLLARTLRGQIVAGSFAEDQRLPTELDLAGEHGLSRQTVRRAYLELVNEGLVFRVPGRGTFVTPERARYRRSFASVDDLMNLTLDTELEVVTPLTGTYDAPAAERLQVKGRSLYSISFCRLHRGEPFCHTWVHLPPSVGASLEGLPDLVTTGHRSTITIIGLIESRGRAIVHAEQTITAVAATRETATVLGCREGDPLLHIERLYSGPAGDPVELAATDFLPKRYSHRQLLGRGNPYALAPATQRRGPSSSRTGGPQIPQEGRSARSG